jgi:hypothetical protein
MLSSPTTRRVVELGCGCGSALLPILRANPACAIAIGVDVSPTCVEQVRGGCGGNLDRGALHACCVLLHVAVVGARALRAACAVHMPGLCGACA